MGRKFFSKVEVDESDVSAVAIADELHLPLSSRPWISLPVVTEWEWDGKSLKAVKIDRFKAPIYDMPSVENLSRAEIEAITSYLEEKYGNTPANPGRDSTPFEYA